ncbi:MAG: glutamate formimidoyltransferase [Phycisphaerales bacterium]|nr:glutamate formimidoyltransferase [Phycisphaerales bacterium]
MPTPIVECVPNFSEGRNPEIIRAITAQVETVPGVKLLDVDPGHATNRTVVTFVGSPAAVVEAAVRTVRKASELIDMRQHHGEHPRFGACDVCPLVPVADITMEETAEYARMLARRLGEELGLTIFCYEHAATRPERRNLATVRAGEYEGLADKLKRPEWQPDFGPAAFNAQSGATAVGARDFLVAYNVNLNTTSTRRANAIAFDIREKGRKLRSGDPLTGPVVRDADGREVWQAGSLKAVKAIGWFIEEYGIAQISINLTNISVTPIHVAFDECCRKAEERGVRVTGSEIVGMVPLSALLEAGRYYLRKQRRSLGVPDRELLKIAVRSLGLDELRPFNPEEKIIEYALARGAEKRLSDRSLRVFTEETASESPAPGGGSISAALGAFGAALGTMVANLSSHKRGWDDRWEEFSTWAERGKQHYVELLRLIDDDTAAFNRLMEAFGLPKSTPEEERARKRAIAAATRGAIEVPLQVMEVSVASMAVARAMATSGMPASASDAGVAALAARAAVRGASLNVQINAKDLKPQDLDDPNWLEQTRARARELESVAEKAEDEILALVGEKLRKTE